VLLSLTRSNSELLLIVLIVHTIFYLVNYSLAFCTAPLGLRVLMSQCIVLLTLELQGKWVGQTSRAPLVRFVMSSSGINLSLALL